MFGFLDRTLLGLNGDTMMNRMDGYDGYGYFYPVSSVPLCQVLLQLLPQLLLFSTRSPDRRRVIVRVPVGAPHPLETFELLIVVRLVVILVLVVLLFLLFRLRSPVLAGPVGLSAPLGRLLALHGSFLAFPPGPSGCVMSANLLGGPMTPDVRHGLHFALLGQLFRLLLFLLQFEALGRRFELLLVHYEKVARTAL